MTSFTLNQAADGWIVWMSGVIVQATVVALIALAIVRWSRQLPANLKYVLLLLAMLKFFTPPFAGWPVGVFSQFTSPTAAIDADTSDPIQPSGLLTTKDDSLSNASGIAEMAEMLQTDSVAAREELIVSEAATHVDLSTREATFKPTSPTVAAATSLLPQLNKAAWLMLCWLIGAVALMLRLAQGSICLRGILEQCNPATGDSQFNFAAVAQSMGVRRARLLLSPEPVTPMACDLFRPKVVIPKSLVEQFTLDEQRAIFAHELAHHRRFDPLMLWIQWSFVAIWWFHPLAWLLNRTILRLREQCCDDLVIVENLATRETYGAALLRAVEWCSTRLRLLEYAAPQMYSFKDRIVSLVDPRTRRAASLSRWNWATVALIGLVILPGFGRLTPEAVASPQAKNLDNNSKPDSPVDERLCVVGGRVLNQQGLPIAAKVWLRTNRGREVRFQSCETDHDGRYQFVNVEPGWTAVAALGDGYSHTGVLFTLQEGRIEKNLNMIATEPKSLNLNIRNEQGEPVPGVELWSIQWNTGSRKSFGLYPKLMEAEQIEAPRSDAGGFLSFPRLPVAANCTVYLRHPDYVGERLENLQVGQPVNVTLKSGYPIVVSVVNAETSEPVVDATVSISGTPDGMNVTNAPVADDGTYRTRLPVQTQNLKVTVRHPRLGTDEVKRAYRDGLVYYEARLHRRGLVRGRVIDESSGKPVSGLQVNLTKQNIGVAQAVSGEDGTFEIPTPAGSYFRISVPGGEGFYSGVYKEPLPGDQQLPGQVLVPATPLDVKVKPDETVVLPDLTVNRLPKVKGIVRMPDGQPAVGVLVHDDTWPPTSYRTDASGRFEFEGKLPDMIHLKAYHLMQPLIADAGITLKDWFAGTELEMRLQPAADVRGKVLDQNEHPAVGVRVSLVSSMSFGPSGKVGTMSSMSRETSSVTDENGDFRFTGLSRDMSYSAVVGAPFEKTSTRSNWLQPPLISTEFEAIRLTAVPPVAGTQMIARIAAPVESRYWLNSPAITHEATQGKVVVLQFCDAVSTKSVDQLVATQEIHDLYKEKGCTVIAVFHSSVSVASLEAIAKEHHISCPLAIDNATGETFNGYDVDYVPSFVLIGRDGRIISDRVADYELMIKVRQAVMESKSGE